MSRRPPKATAGPSPRGPLSTGRLLRRAVLLRCPVCGGGHIIRRWVGLVERCPTCGLRYERTSGHNIGYIGLNTMVSFTVLFLTMAIGFIVTYPDPPVGLLVAISLGVALLFPLVFAPFAHTVWIAIDLAMTPLEVGEVDPGWELDQYDDG